MQRRGVVGVASWSLRPATAEELADRVSACGLDAVQIALDPLRTGAMPQSDVERILASRGMRVLSGMMTMLGEDYSTMESIRITGGIVPDETWNDNLAAARANARIARDLGIRLVTFHAGFVPHDDTALRERLIARLRAMADTFGEYDIAIALETGQESAATLAELLTHMNHTRIGVNFDPANMILYGMGDPVAAAQLLAPWIRQVHIKDAIPTEVPGTWGREVPVGAGAVEWHEFLRTLRESRVDCDLIIEREAGDDRLTDIRAAVALLRQENAL